jgi:hypothetical protein
MAKKWGPNYKHSAMNNTTQFWNARAAVKNSTATDYRYNSTCIFLLKLQQQKQRSNVLHGIIEERK